MLNNKILMLFNDIAILFPVFLLVFTFKGFFQALAAKLMGDDTAQEEGFLTLNPIAHIDIFGLTTTILVFFFVGGLFGDSLPRAILFILLITFGVRWTIPVPIDDRNFKNYRLGGIMTALSGSFGNFVLAAIAIACMKILLALSLPAYASKSLFELIRSTIDLAIIFGVLDLIPLPPFDGGRVLRYALPESKQYIVEWLEQYALFIVLIVFFLPGVSDFFFGTISFLSSLIKRGLFKLFFF